MSWSIRLASKDKGALRGAVMAQVKNYLPETYAAAIIAQIDAVKLPETQTDMGIVVISDGHVWDGIGQGTIAVSLATMP
jgi:porphobilinogen deaminase